LGPLPTTPTIAARKKRRFPPELWYVWIVRSVASPHVMSIRPATGKAEPASVT
jgi:hypothetical protein